MTDLKNMTDQARVIAFVTAAGGWSAYQISKHLDLDPSTVSSFLKRMVDKGTLRRAAKRGPKGGYVYYAQ